MSGGKTLSKASSLQGGTKKSCFSLVEPKVP